MTDAPSFWILDGCTPDHRDGLYGIATTTQATWWANDFGRLYAGRHHTWSQDPISDEAPVSLAYRDARPGVARAWFVLGARGTLLEFGAKTREYTLDVRGSLRRLRMIGEQLVAVGAHGQVLRGRSGKLVPMPALPVAAASTPRFLVDLAGTSDDDLTTVGRAGEVFHWDGAGWHAWGLGGEDLHVVTLVDGVVIVGGDRGRIARRVDGAWQPISIATTEPIVGLAWFAGALWAATPTAVFTGDLRALAPDPGPGFGGQLTVGDGILYCFGVAAIARRIEDTWAPLPHPDQHYTGPPPAWPSLGDALEAATADVVDPAAELGGRLYTADEVGKPELARWTKLSRSPGQVRELLADPGIYRILEVRGDLHVRGDLVTFERKLTGLVVHGDLIVDGVFRDCDHPQTLTLVGGALRARTVITSGQLEVTGAVTCDHLIGDYNDFSAELHGPVTARLFWPENHAFRLAVRPSFGLVVGEDAPHRVNREVKAAVVAARPAELRAGLVAMLLRGDEDDELEVDRKAALVELLGGRAILTGPAPARAVTARPAVARAKPAVKVKKAKAKAKPRPAAKAKENAKRR